MLCVVAIAGCAEVVGIGDFRTLEETEETDESSSEGSGSSASSSGTSGSGCSEVCLDGFTCNPDTSACVPCGLVGQVCCEGACEPGYGCNESTNVCDLCGQDGQLCCDGACEPGLSCSTSTGVCASCGSPGQACCGNGCNAGLECANGTCSDTCGSGGAPCCASLCDGEMACTSGACKGACSVRCAGGALLMSTSDQPTKSACVTFADAACVSYDGTSKVRVQYNSVLVADSGACGGVGQACCPGNMCASGSCVGFNPPVSNNPAYIVVSGIHCQ